MPNAKRCFGHCTIEAKQKARPLRGGLNKQQLSYEPNWQICVIPL